jgi:Sulfatase
MNSTPTIRALILSASILALTVGSTFAQQTTGTPGSPSATTTIDGKYLPPPPAPFGGTINMDAKDSKPFWPSRVVPPKGSPNVLLIMTDDQGYGITSTFGGVIPTPALDQIAKAGCATRSFTPPRCARPRERR